MKKISAIKERIYALRGGGSKFSADRMREFARALGNPQDAARLVHIAGTNGKGSTSAFVESILRAHGFSCGLFTSPHLLRINERIQLNRGEISDSDFEGEFEVLDKAASELSTKNPELSPTFFEYITALAFQYFKHKKADWGVIEVGLGGRLDSTNIIKPKICAITSIGFDHMQYLGNTIPEIAREKAGIIKENTPVVCGILPEEAMREIENAAREKNAPLYRLEDYFASSPQFDVSMPALYQKKNAALAFLICKILGDLNEIEFSEAAAKDAILDTFWAARWQKIELKNNSTLILDCSHNAEGAIELDKNLTMLEEKSGGEKPIIACGILGRERALPLLEVIARHAKKIIFLKPGEDRALTFGELKECMPKNSDVKTENSSVQELFSENAASSEYKNETLVCTGSCYLAGEVLARISGRSRDFLQDILPAKNSPTDLV